jgi:hypothetical protein
MNLLLKDETEKNRQKIDKTMTGSWDRDKSIESK